jgi:hypothetical protein
MSRSLTWLTFTRAIEFGLGVAILIASLTEDSIHWGVVFLALVLMGVIGTGAFAEVIRARASWVPPPVPASRDLDVIEDDGDEQ